MQSRDLHAALNFQTNKPKYEKIKLEGVQQFWGKYICKCCKTNPVTIISMNSVSFIYSWLKFLANLLFMNDNPLITKNSNKMNLHACSDSPNLSAVESLKIANSRSKLGSNLWFICYFCYGSFVPYLLRPIYYNFRICSDQHHPPLLETWKYMLLQFMKE